MKRKILLSVVGGLAICGTAMQAAGGPLKVYLLVGQSNMQGQGVVDFDHPKHYNGGKGILKNVMKIPKNGDSVPASQEEKPKTASGSGVLNPPSRESSRPAGTCVGQNNEI